MSKAYTYKDGRIWVQLKKFESYKLLLAYGLTDISDPVGNLNPVREPSATRRRKTVVTDTIRAEPGLPGFTIETRLKRTFNYLLGLADKKANFQAHLGTCDRPDSYSGSEIGLGWGLVRRGDASIDRTAIIEGDDQPIAMQAPFMAETGPTFIDFQARFLSARTINETENVTDIVFLTDECDDISIQHDPGDIGYLVTQVLSGSPINQADAWYTVNAGESWEKIKNSSGTPVQPFAAAEDISAVVVNGSRNNHRVIFFRGTADGSNPAECAYSDVTVDGTVSLVYADIGAVDGEYVTSAAWPSYNALYVTTDQGNVYKSTNGGATWALVLTATDQLNDVSALLNGNVWVCGDAALVYHSEDEGESWDLVDPPTGVAANATAVEVTPDGTLFVGFGTTLYGTYNEGLLWSSLSVASAFTQINDIKAYDDHHIYVAADASGGGLVFRSTDGGANFRLWNLNVPENSGLNALFVVNPNYVFVGGDAHESVAFVTKTNSNGLGVVTA